MEPPTDFADGFLELLQEVFVSAKLKNNQTIREWYEADLGEFENCMSPKSGRF